MSPDDPNPTTPSTAPEPLGDLLAMMNATQKLQAQNPRAEQEAAEYEAERKREREVNRAFEDIVDEEFADVSFEALCLLERCPHPEAIRAAKAAVESRAKRVVITGPSGAGKTTLAVAMLRAAFDARASVMLSSAEDLALARMQWPNGRGEAEYVTRSISRSVVIVDDVLAEANTPTNAVKDVLKKRHGKQRITYVTTGFSPHAIDARYGAGTLRRIFKDAVWIKLGEVPS